MARDCSSFVPPIAGGAGKQCTFVPNSLEIEAGKYNAGADTISGLDRRAWSQQAQRTLTHETEHARFAASAASPGGVKDPANPCDFDAIRGALSELAAIISEFKPVHQKALGLRGAARDAEPAWWFEFWINKGSENIAGNLRAIRCICECDPANAYINRIFDFASSSWSAYEKWLYNDTLADPKWKLDWPVVPPLSVPINEIPGAKPTVNVADLPHANP
jgi:hypothetical protein